MRWAAGHAEEDDVLDRGAEVGRPGREGIVELVERSRSHLSSDPAKAMALATKPIGPLPAGLDAVEAAAWSVAGNILLNLDEVLTKR